MKATLTALLIFLTVNTISSQELIKGISYDMSKKEAKAIINSNPESFKLTIGTANFIAPNIHASEGLTKVVEFSEPLSLTGSKSKTSAIDKANSIRDFFNSKGFTLMRQAEPSEGNSALGASATNILLMRKEDVYMAVVCTSVDTGSAFSPQYNYSIILRLTSAKVSDDIFKKYMFYPKASENSNANNLF